MLIEMQAQNFPLGHEIRNHITHRLLFTLTGHGEKIKNIKVLISDIDRSLSGTDKRCQIKIALHQLPDVVIENEGGDMFDAIELAVDTASQTLETNSNHHLDWFPASRLPKFQVPSELGDSHGKTH